MKTTAIICEFNPLHNGHTRLIDKAREGGADRILCIMSGNFIQRGEPAVMDKYTRARSAVLAGADIVLEMPLPFAAGSAEYFAWAGVYIADKLGLADELMFGSESGDIDELRLIAKRQLSPEYSQRLSEIYRGDAGYPAAMQRAYEELYGKSGLLNSPNNILAIEYIKSLIRLSSPITAATVRREDNYSSDQLGTSYPSATALRRLIERSEVGELASHMPMQVYKELCAAGERGLFPINMNKYGEYALSYLRLCHKDDLSNIVGMGGGIENRILQAASVSSTYEELLCAISTKKYTDAKLRRAILASLLGVTNTHMERDIPYVRLLAAGRKGREMLALLRKNENIFIATKTADIKGIFEGLETGKRTVARRLYEIEKRADALFTLCLPHPKEAGFFGKMMPFVEK